MNIKLSEKDRALLALTALTDKCNVGIIELYAAYLNNEPRFITGELVGELVKECGIDEEGAFRALLSAAFGLDGEKREEDRRLERRYISRSVKMLDSREYTANPYYANIKIPEASCGEWSFGMKYYAPYEGFIYDDLFIDTDYTEIPQLGFFRERFCYPAVFEKGREWMTITPNEINTMKDAISAAHGRVVTFGLGMGYYAYMASEKDEVDEVTVVERDERVIALFKKHILPQFSHPGKVRLVCEDAFDFARGKMAGHRFDLAFVDIWHDASDGFDLYIKMRKLEPLSGGTVFMYWIERSLLSQLRRMVIESTVNGLDGKGGAGGALICSYAEISNMLKDSYLRKLACDIKRSGL